MIVVSIKEVNKQRSRILLDNDEEFVLYRSEIRSLKIKENEEIAENVYDNIINVLLPKRCKLRAMNLLKMKDYTEQQLRLKLSEGGYPNKIVEAAIDYVKSYGYINDYQYALQYYQSKISEKSTKEIVQKLQYKGISKDVIEKVVNSEDELFKAKDSEDELIRKTLNKKQYKADLPYEDKQKILAYFYRRGFNIDRVRRIMDKVDEDWEG